MLVNDIPKGIDEPDISENSKNTTKGSRWVSECLSVMCVCLVSIFPVFYLYFQNAEILPFSEIVSSLGLFTLVGIVLYAILRLVTKSAFKSAVLASIGSLAFAMFSSVEKFVNWIFPRAHYWHILPVIIYVFCLITYLFIKKMGENVAAICCKIIAFMFSLLLVFNFITAIPVYVNSMQNNNTYALVSSTVDASQPVYSEQLPNVYWLIFDEYSSNDVLKKYYDFDNTSFMHELQNRGFNYSSTSSNESFQTATVLANYVQMEYVVSDSMPAAQKTPYRMSGPVFDLAEGHGYIVKAVGKCNSTIGTGYLIDESNLSAYGTIDGDSFQDVMLSNTPLQPFLADNRSDSEAMILDSLAYFENPDMYTDEQLFSLLYMYCPHQPFLFDAQGNSISSGNYDNWIDKQYYLDYLIWCSGQILNVVDNILLNDPNSIIILQSDHSARQLSTVDEELLITAADRKQCLNAVYYQGQTMDIEGLSGVNALRAIFNRLYGMNMEMLEVPA